MTSALLEFRGVSKIFGSRGSRPDVAAVDDVSFSVSAGACIGVVGESGSGKSTLARMALGLIRPSSGEIRYDGQPVVPVGRRGRKPGPQAVFQDPSASLSPRMRVGDIIAEPLLVQCSTGRNAQQRVDEVLQLCGLPASAAEKYPFEFSGGQRQRIAIARAIAPSPRLIVLDEPVSALDVSVRAQVLNLFSDLRGELGLSYLLIAHDLAVMEFMCEHLAVMHNGRLVEHGTRDQIYGSPEHPYTRSLLDSVLPLTPRRGGPPPPDADRLLRANC